MAVVGAGDVAKETVCVHDRLFAHDDGVGVVEGHAAELARVALCAKLCQCVAADKVSFVHAHGEIDAGLVGIVLGVDVLAPEPIALFEAEGVEGAAAGRDQAERLARLPENVPEAQALLERGVEFPSEFANVGDAQGQDGDLGDC